MTVYYVGPGGSDGANGLTWDTRKLTLNGAEDIPVQAGDTVYVGPGTYRERLTVDVNGSSGSPIRYVGDVTGAFTDGIGGIVRITASDDDNTNARSYCIYSNSHTYREFAGFHLDHGSTAPFYTNNGLNGFVIEDCVFSHSITTYPCLVLWLTSGNNIVIRRCIFHPGLNQGINVTGSGGLTVTVLIENCLFIANPAYALSQDAIQFGTYVGLTVRNCTFMNFHTALDGNWSIGNNYFYNNIVSGGYYGIDEPETVEDYNVFDPVLVMNTSGTPGSNSIERIIHFQHPMTGMGNNLEPFDAGRLDELNGNAIIRNDDDGNAPDHDLFGLPRPATNGKRSLGAIQYQGVFRETTITRNSSASSLGLDDAGVAQFIIPCIATPMTVSVYVYREANYAGTYPQLIVRRPGYSDITVTDTGSAETWNLLTTDFIHYGKPEWIAVLLKSNNTATSGDYKVYFDDLLAE